VKAIVNVHPFNVSGTGEELRPRLGQIGGHRETPLALDRVGDLRCFGVGDAECSRDSSQSSVATQACMNANHRNVSGAVDIERVSEHGVTLIPWEVHVEVWWVRSAWAQKTLEEETESDWVDVRYPQAKDDHAGCAASAPAGAATSGEIGDGQDVAAKIFGGYHRELVFDALRYGIGEREPVASFGADHRPTTQLAGGV